MGHRIEVELTSQSDESTWTWRAAGAKLPRGTVSAELVPPGTTVGSVLRAEVEMSLDGTTVTALLAPKGKTEPKPIERIEVLGTPQKGPDVNVVLAGKGKRRRDDYGDGDRDGSRRPSGRGPRTEGGRPSRSDGDRAPRGEGARPPRGEGRPRDGATTGEGGAPGGARRPGPTRPGGREGAGRDRGDRRPATSTVYRNAALAELRPEQLPVAEQLLRGGIPSVRQAIQEQNARARAEGRPEVTEAPLMAMAEELRPVINLATWKDRASVARNSGKDTPLRELRSIVASASTVTLDDEGSEMVTSLRTSLNERITALRERWVERITTSLDEGRVLDAVRASIRPPEPSARLSAELAVRLADAAGQAMTSDLSPEAWLALLEVVVECPVRRTVKPAGLPVGADEAVLSEARKAAGHVPELARLMGIPIPPPPGPRRPVPARPAGRRAS
ncbi:MAG: hypothetical protein ABSF84_05650 [Acidimicrobiales bacterium]|jgi:hypothetical protein